MSGAELPLAIIGTVDLSIKYGQKLMKLCASVKGTEDEIIECVLRVESRWMRTVHQLEFMQRVGGLMDAYHRQINEKTVEVLQSKLKVVTTKLERVVKMPDSANTENNDSRITRPRPPLTPRRWKYALLKESIDEAIKELEVWQQETDPSWYLVLKIASSQIDLALVVPETKSQTAETIATSFPLTRTIRAGLREVEATTGPTGIFLPADELNKLIINDIPFCEAKAAV